MAKINLLPWREELRRQKKQDFFIAIGLSVVAAFIILGAVHFHIAGLLDYQQQRNKILQDEIALVDKKIVEIKAIEEKKNKLLAKIDLIYKLQKSRPEVVHLFEEIPKATPDGLFLTKFTQQGDELIFEGRTQSNARVSAFMRFIESSQWLQKPTLNLIKVPEKDKTDSNDLSEFVLRAKQGKENKEIESGKVEVRAGKGVKP